MNKKPVILYMAFCKIKMVYVLPFSLPLCNHASFLVLSPAASAALLGPFSHRHPLHCLMIENQTKLRSWELELVRKFPSKRSENSIDLVGHVKSMSPDTSQHTAINFKK